MIPQTDALASKHLRVTETHGNWCHKARASISCLDNNNMQVLHRTAVMFENKMHNPLSTLNPKAQFVHV
jgi:hypothetical protein